jgi:hypothetical protein
MHRLRTIALSPYRGREFFATVFVEPDPAGAESFDVGADAEDWGISIHFQPEAPYESHVEVARIDTEHGEPHFDRLYEPNQPKEWLGREYSYREAREELLSNWREYADRYLRNHGSDGG